MQKQGSTQPQITVRPARPADYDDVARITRDSYVTAGYYGDPEHPYLRQLQDVAGRAAHADVWVAERDGAVIGSVTVASAGGPFADIAYDDELEMRTLVVDPAVQRSGAGKSLVKALMDHARSRAGINAVALTTGATWESANALYRATGFERVPERDWFVPGTDIKLFVYRREVGQP
ncbi:GNAT family N-acetyltransferase [Arthrobacter sp. SW1]|uniref:GNAT family N-acetyltransferase n=1 Tax=Arthrobacter sp. SW1 TaxID=1920889 RepID=UPI000AA6B91A|nr:GNAT family N-acetyltransferase [Arthrobacter sp. SW1]